MCEVFRWIDKLMEDKFMNRWLENFWFDVIELKYVISVICLDNIVCINLLKFIYFLFIVVI